MLAWTARSCPAFLANLRDYKGAAGAYFASGDNRFLLAAALERVMVPGFGKSEERNR